MKSDSSDLQLPDAPPEELEGETEMDFWDHIGELRKRIIISVLAITICSFVGWYISQMTFNFLVAPYHEQFTGAQLIGTGPAEAFILRLKVAIFTGAILASPALSLQIWLFIEPGLLDGEKKMAIPFVLCTSLLFLTGAAFCYYVVLPFALDFFKQQYEALGEITPTIRISEYLGLLIKAVIGFGAIFETPILAFFLGRLGILTADMLIESGRYAVVVIFIISAILTPPDILTQFLMAGPLMILYGVSILIVKWTEPKEELETSHGE